MHGFEVVNDSEDQVQVVLARSAAKQIAAICKNSQTSSPCLVNFANWTHRRCNYQLRCLMCKLKVFAHNQDRTQKRSASAGAARGSHRFSFSDLGAQPDLKSFHGSINFCIQSNTCHEVHRIHGVMSQQMAVEQRKGRHQRPTQRRSWQAVAASK